MHDGSIRGEQTGSVAMLTRRAQAVDGPLPCQRVNPQLWFSDQPADLELARAYCRPCPLRGPCLAGAVARGEPHGVWGGQIFHRGAIIPRKRPRGRPPNPPAGLPGRPAPDRPGRSAAPAGPAASPASGVDHQDPAKGACR